MKMATNNRIIVFGQFRVCEAPRTVVELQSSQLYQLLTTSPATYAASIQNSERVLEFIKNFILSKVQLVHGQNVHLNIVETFTYVDDVQVEFTVPSSTPNSP